MEAKLALAGPTSRPRRKAVLVGVLSIGLSAAGLAAAAAASGLETWDLSSILQLTSDDDPPDVGGGARPAEAEPPKGQASAAAVEAHRPGAFRAAVNALQWRGATAHKPPAGEDSEAALDPDSALDPPMIEAYASPPGDADFSATFVGNSRDGGSNLGSALIGSGGGGGRAAGAPDPAPGDPPGLGGATTPDPLSSTPDPPGANLAGVPEPATWAILTLGFGVVGALQRRRRLTH